jgi:hypothetical protein
MDVEILICHDMSRRGHRILEAMAASAGAVGVNAIVNDRWRQAAPIVMTYGLGHRERRHWTDAHRKQGGRVIAWDLGYWNRDGKDCNMRVTLDEDHPWRMIKPESGARFAATGIELRDDRSPTGHVVIVGMGRKQRAWKGHPHQEWERHAIKSARAEFPKRRVYYRPKKPEYLPGTPTIGGEIDVALKGASLVVCHHSNVAVDACVAGIPVRCEDGAAYALYRHGENPTRAERLSFLESLAHWQYAPSEGLQAWSFIKARLEG